MLYARDPFRAHTGAVGVLAGVGIEPPAGWQELRDRFTDNPGATMLDRYIRAVVDGDPKADLIALRAAALAESTAGSADRAAVSNAVKKAVGSRLRDLYAPVAGANYTVVAKLFDTAATQLTTAVAVVDPDADPASIVTADAKTRTSWADAAIAAAELTRLTPVLQAAAELCGVATGTPEHIFALTVDAEGVHRRKAWEAFKTTTGRCGRWGALVAVGARIRAHQPITELQPYRQPKPMEEKWENTGRRGSHRRIVVDPEDLPVTAS